MTHCGSEGTCYNGLRMPEREIIPRSTATPFGKVVL